MVSQNIWFYSLASVFIVSLISLIGVFCLKTKIKKIKKIILFLVAFSGGALFGDAFIHLLPEAIEESGLNLYISGYILLGIILFFVVEKFVHWHHCHSCHFEPEKKRLHSFVYMNLFGDSVHNFIDGLIIGASYIVSIPVGIATTIAVVLHEIPQEIGDFGVLLHGGFSTSKALITNFLVSLAAIFGTILALTLNGYIPQINSFLIPFAAGGFIYIAGSDLIPELHKEIEWKKSAIQIITFILGIAVMYGLLFLE
jgi:zinc and cadmium transporter